MRYRFKPVDDDDDVERLTWQEHLFFYLLSVLWLGLLRLFMPGIGYITRFASGLLFAIVARIVYAVWKEFHDGDH